MRKVKEYYNVYNYPKINFYTKQQVKKHHKLITKILAYGNLSVEDLKSKTILDAGCGTGEKSIFFAKHGAKVTAIDLSSGQLKVLKEKIKIEKLDIVVKKKDIVNDDLLDLGTFDVVVCTGVLHHTEAPYKGFLNLLKLLRPGGVIIIALYHKYARIRYRLIRLFLHLFISRDPKKLEMAFNKLKFLYFLKNAPANSIYDRYLVPHESYHTIREVKKWFKNNNVIIGSFSKEFKGIEEFKVFTKKTLFFISGIKK